METSGSSNKVAFFQNGFEKKKLLQRRTVPHGIDPPAGRQRPAMPGVHGVQQGSRLGPTYFPDDDAVRTMPKHGLIRIETALFVRKDQMRASVKDFISLALSGIRTLKLNRMEKG